MSLHNPSQGAPPPILPADTFADIPFDPVTGLFAPSGTFGNFMAGQKFLTLDDGNMYEVMPDGSGGLTLVHPSGFLLFGVVGVSIPALDPIPRGFLVTQDTGGAPPQRYVTNVAGFPTQACTLRSAAVGTGVPVLTSGIVMVPVVNGVTIMPGQKITGANGKAQTAGATSVAISVDSSSRTGNAGGTVLVKAVLTPVGNP